MIRPRLCRMPTWRVLQQIQELWKHYRPVEDTKIGKTSQCIYSTKLSLKWSCNLAVWLPKSWTSLQNNFPLRLLKWCRWRLTSSRKAVRAWPTYGTASAGTNSRTLATSAAVRIGLWMIGPLVFRISKGMFMPVNGVKMSENRITCTRSSQIRTRSSRMPSKANSFSNSKSCNYFHWAFWDPKSVAARCSQAETRIKILVQKGLRTPSGLNARHGCNEISTAKSTFSERSLKVGCFWHRSWYTYW